MQENNFSTPTPPPEPELPPVQPESFLAQGDSLSLDAARFSKTEPASPVPLVQTSPTPNLEIDAEPIAARPVRLSEPVWVTILKAAGVFVGTFVAVFLILDAPALYQRARYVVTNTASKTDEISKNLAGLPILRDRPIRLADIKDRPQDYLAPGAQLAGYTLADLGDNTLLIPKIEVNVPIVWSPESDEASMLTALQQGVAHYNFTALPNAEHGNVFLSGHSSYLFWDPGKYKTVFANLDRLGVGDQMAITYQGQVYIYEVEQTEVVKPDQVNVLDPTDEPKLSLMTCVPVGTSLNRLIVRSRLISAQSTKPIPVPPPTLKDANSIFDYLPF